MTTPRSGYDRFYLHSWARWAFFDLSFLCFLFGRSHRGEPPPFLFCLCPFHVPPSPTTTNLPFIGEEGSFFATLFLLVNPTFRVPTRFPSFSPIFSDIFHDNQEYRSFVIPGIGFTLFFRLTFFSTTELWLVFFILTEVLSFSKAIFPSCSFCLRPPPPIPTCWFFFVFPRPPEVGYRLPRVHHFFVFWSVFSE